MASKSVFAHWIPLPVAGEPRNRVPGPQSVQCINFFPGRSQRRVLSKKHSILRKMPSSDIQKDRIYQETKAIHNSRLPNLPKATVDSVLQSMRDAVHREGGTLENTEDKILLRFLRSKDENVNEAAKNFVTYQKWRKDFLPLGYVSESTIASELKLQQSYLQGLDKKGHPVLVTFANKHEIGKGDFEEYKRFLVYSFEKTLASAPEGIDRIVTIVDLKGLGLKNLDSAAFITAFQIQQDYYPDTLEKAFMINVPFIFYGLWKIVSPFLEQATRESIVFVEGNKLKETLLNHIDLDQLPVIYGGNADLVLLQDAVVSNYPTC